VIITLGLVLTLFLFRLGIARFVVIWFGSISFLLVFAKEEVLRAVMVSKLGQAQGRRCFVLVGSPEETARMRKSIQSSAEQPVEILEELDPNHYPVERLTHLLHEHSVNGVMISARGALFDRVEAAIRLCELEGVEVWLLADFCRTQISRTTFGQMHGLPVLLFSSAPKASWRDVPKQLLASTVALADACLFAISFWIAYALRTNTDVIRLFRLLPVVSDFDLYLWLFLILIPAAPLVLEAQGFYNRPLFASRSRTAWLLLKTCSILTLGLVLALFLFRIDIARMVIVWFGGISFLLVFAKEEVLRVLRARKFAREQCHRRFILVGSPEETLRMRRNIQPSAEQTIEILDELDLSHHSVERLNQLLQEQSIDGVMISAKRALFDRVEAAIRLCEVKGVKVWLLADFFQTQISRTTFDEMPDLPVLVFSSAPEASWQGMLKQLLDFAVALIALLTLAIPLALIALAVKLSSPGPIFFRQQRSGLNGHPFTIFKFRTMVTNAEQLKHELEAMNEMRGPVFKITNDPRITPLGKFLRKFSLDEFPQFYNVIRGEMSLVGPRPLPVHEVSRFNDLAHRRRLSVKPGLTCLWQISGRNNVKDFKDWVRLDLEYIDHWSFWLDLKILWRTIPVVLFGTGAK